MLMPKVHPQQEETEFTMRAQIQYKHVIGRCVYSRTYVYVYTCVILNGTHRHAYVWQAFGCLLYLLFESACFCLCGSLPVGKHSLLSLRLSLPLWGIAYASSLPVLSFCLVDASVFVGRGMMRCLLTPSLLLSS